MNLDMAREAAAGYKSGCQIARRISEHWGASNLFCAACDSNSLLPTAANTKAVDFQCPNCGNGYQLKAGRHWSERRVPDAGYSAMMAAIAGDNVPNLLVLQYTPKWRVNNLMLIPSFLFNASAVQKRKPLAPTARRAGWVGCNILLDAMPAAGKVRIVNDGSILTSQDVRAQYQRLQPLAKLSPKIRGWTLDVLRAVQSLGRQQFSLADIYTFNEKLRLLHPSNDNVRPKIRQQLQKLRDAGILSFLGNGQYTLREQIPPKNPGTARGQYQEEL